MKKQSPIPRVLHQIWFQGEDQLSPKHRDRVERWKQMHSKWKYKLWDERSMRDYIKRKCSPKCLKTFDRFPYMHQQIDFFKYAVLFCEGGCYVDMDVEPLKPLDQLLESHPAAETMVSEIGMGDWEKRLVIGSTYFINNGIIFSCPNSPVLRDLIDHICSLPSDGGGVNKISCIQRTTGPRVFSQICEKWDGTPRLTVLPSCYLEPCYGLDPMCSPDERAFADHRHEQTWISPMFQPFLRFYFFIKWLVKWIVDQFLGKF